jgi:hypothetical protein
LPTLDVKTITYTHNNSAGDPYTISADRRQLIFNNKVKITPDQNMLVNVSILFTNNLVINDTRMIRLVKNPMILTLN